MQKRNLLLGLVLVTVIVGLGFASSALDPRAQVEIEGTAVIPDLSV